MCALRSHTGTRYSAWSHATIRYGSGSYAMDKVRHDCAAGCNWWPAQAAMARVTKGSNAGVITRDVSAPRGVGSTPVCGHMVKGWLSNA